MKAFSSRIVHKVVARPEDMNIKKETPRPRDYSFFGMQGERGITMATELSPFRRSGWANVLETPSGSESAHRPRAENVIDSDYAQRQRNHGTQPAHPVPGSSGFIGVREGCC